MIGMSLDGDKFESVRNTYLVDSFFKFLGLSEIVNYFRKEREHPKAAVDKIGLGK